MQLQKIIVILGPPGSGKGTQSKLLIQKLGFAYFSMGDTLRQYAKEDTSLGKKIKELINQGIIVTDDLAAQVAKDSWAKITDKPGLVLEGFPRTPGQVKILNEFMVEHQIRDLKALFIDVDKEKLLKRLSLRKTCSNCQASFLPGTKEYESEICSVCGHKLSVRADDLDAKFVEKRFEEYLEKTAQIIKHYEKEGQLIQINGDQSIEEVHKEIMGKLVPLEIDQS